MGGGGGGVQVRLDVVHQNVFVCFYLPLFEDDEEIEILCHHPPSISPLLGEE